MDTSRLPLTRALRRLGFKRQDQIKDPLIYVKKVRCRALELQLWKAGGHRVSHFVCYGPRHARRRMSTPPTAFATVPEMEAAIEHELTRTDHPPRGQVHPALRAPRKAA
jgi:hypothetical protein